MVHRIYRSVQHVTHFVLESICTKDKVNIRSKVKENQLH